MGLNNPALLLPRQILSTTSEAYWSRKEKGQTTDAACPLPFHIKVGRVGSVHVLHDLRQVCVRSLYQQVVVIGYETINMDLCTMADCRRFQIRKELLPVLIAQKIILMFVSSGCKIIKYLGSSMQSPPAILAFSLVKSVGLPLSFSPYRSLILR